VDVVGAALGALGLGALTDGLIAWQDRGLGSPSVLIALVLGLAALLWFVVQEHRSREPMLPLGIFRSRLFTAANLVTFAVYAALGGVFFWLILCLQVVAGFTPVEAGLSLIPMTVLMLLLSARAGALATRTGPRLPMTVGPVLCAVGVAFLTRVDTTSSYAVDVLPPVILFGLGLSLTVAPLTATVLAAAPDNHAGLASGVNNAVARVAGLLAVAVLPLVAGLSGEAYSNASLLQPAYRVAMWFCTGLLAAGGVLAAVFVRTPAGLHAVEHRSCPLNAPPLNEQSAHV
jgi:predicted MFS family arabinose efflux permease